MMHLFESSHNCGRPGVTNGRYFIGWSSSGGFVDSLCGLELLP